MQHWCTCDCYCCRRGVINKTNSRHAAEHLLISLLGYFLPLYCVHGDFKLVTEYVLNKKTVARLCIVNVLRMNISDVSIDSQVDFVIILNDDLDMFAIGDDTTYDDRDETQAGTIWACWLLSW